MSGFDLTHSGCELKAGGWQGAAPQEGRASVLRYVYIEEAKIEWCSRRPAKTADWGARDVGDGGRAQHKAGSEASSESGSPV